MPNQTFSRDVIIVAEDDPNMAALLDYHLTKSGYDVVVVDNGLTAVRTIDLRKPRLCLLDMTMPEMNGIDVLRHIKSTYREREVIVIMLSGDDDPWTQQESLLLGAAEYLVKPVQAQVLLNAIDAQLKASKHQPDPHQDVIDEGESRQLPGLPSLQNWTHGDDAALRTAVTRFIEDADVRVFAIDAACNARDLERVKRLSQQYQSVLLNLEAPEAASTAKQISDAASNGAAEPFAPLVEAFRQDVSNAVTSLRRWERNTRS